MSCSPSRQHATPVTGVASSDGQASGDAPTLSDAERQALLAAFTRNGRFPRIDKAEIAGYVAGHPEVRDRLQALNTLLHRDTLHFGYRVFDETVTFLAV